MDARRKEMERMAKLYMEYLNSPFGKRVMNGLKEGESFSIHSTHECMKITKIDGKAIVRVEDRYRENIEKSKLQSY
ncbi:MAG: hypothetical protein ACFFED_12130 [Candidatus Thorarchaeota archaeon]